MHPEEAKNQLLASRGDQFDPEIVDLLIAIDEKKMPFCPISGAPGKE
jgi:HD-GYP domain-containing protein (c-di-GMP phosphodiesterase class II)